MQLAVLRWALPVLLVLSDCSSAAVVKKSGADTDPNEVASAAADALEAVSKNHNGKALQDKRDRWAQVCKLKLVGSQSRAECDNILAGMDEDIEKANSNTGVYGEIIGHLRGIADNPR
mmetsp:Transcript_137001/g.438301  ORF Transcript_137001/g.438301 Transcript_137001/m.438301 type:complete len:118 (+) Transcript_137001:59-412(+)|eukprot:CAMPEP_0203962064 /NCGR_PEP_ID=MMETSP0359-20131031/92355_1 /ASSEMBLY_ACC=CAM_ASM_000338 /TAXON_ID=268821 /ORGANISM="Scrippsiella Hangoei, Strain SHTV-5" /LENGTH=117 /DNA_ID=CAMNT_0050897211 /DNA_START=60 /DNA_END=413 /DNA_ORIENTATION=+